MTLLLSLVKFLHHNFLSFIVQTYLDKFLINNFLQLRNRFLYSYFYKLLYLWHLFGYLIGAAQKLFYDWVNIFLFHLNMTHFVKFELIVQIYRTNKLFHVEINVRILLTPKIFLIKTIFWVIFLSKFFVLFVFLLFDSQITTFFKYLDIRF